MQPSKWEIQLPSEPPLSTKKRDHCCSCTLFLQYFILQALSWWMQKKLIMLFIRRHNVANVTTRVLICIQKNKINSEAKWNTCTHQQRKTRTMLAYDNIRCSRSEHKSICWGKNFVHQLSKQLNHQHRQRQQLFTGQFIWGRIMGELASENTRKH